MAVTPGLIVRRVVRPAVFIGASLPFALLALDLAAGDLGANPVESVTHGCRSPASNISPGFAALTLLAVTLAVTPMRTVTGIGAVGLLRRPLGLFAFFYACLHVVTYAVDQTYLSGLGLSLSAIVEDVAERPYITIGFTAFVLLVPLALTSTKGWIKRLGATRWQRLHRLVYIAAVLGVLHFVWLVKADLLRPLVFAAVFAVLLVFRLVVRRRRSDPRIRQEPTHPPNAPGSRRVTLRP